MEYDDIDTVRKCMELLPASACSYEEWLHVGMVLYDLLGETGCPEWENWSMNDSRYHEGECYRKWMGFGRNADKVSVGTIVKYVKDHGLWESVPRQEIPEDAELLDWGDAIPDYGSKDEPKVVRAEYIVPVSIKTPNDEWDQLSQMRDYLSAVFGEEDRVSYCVKAFEYARKDGSKSWRPVNAGNSSRTAGELIAELDRLAAKGEKHDVGAVIGDYNEQAGVWVRVNGVSSSDGTDASVSSFVNCLVECDSKTPEEQLAIIRKLNLPCAAIVHSGGKSIHAIVRVDAKTEREYQKRVDRLFQECEKAGLPLDRQNRNPSRYSRLPGVLRGGRKQFLIDVNCGAQSWEAWVDWLQEQTDDLPEIIGADTFIDNPPALADELIAGILRKGHKMLISGPSKAGKSFLLLELGCAIANGSKWLGLQCLKGICLYVNLEVQDESNENRISVLWKACGWPSTTQRNLQVWNLRGKSLTLEKMAPMVIRRAKGIEGLAAIIIDPIYKVMTGDENKASDMARFCNFFDAIAAQCHCAVIYCHHHSKGSQGDKKSQDRASGSGVFARDPDALLDMIELDVDDQRRKTVVERMLCDRMAALLDGTASDWRNMIPQDEALRVGSMEAFMASVGEDASKVREEVELSMSKASAWRIDGILREFPPMKPINLWFVWPVHKVDESGILDDVMVDGQTKPKGPYVSKKDKLDAQIAELMMEMDRENGKADVAVIAKRMNLAPKVVYRLARASHEIKIDNGKMERIKQ